MRYGRLGIMMLFLVFSGTVFGQADYVWNNPLGARFDDPCNWTPEGPPGGGDRAVFDLAGAYRVEFGDHFTNDQLLVDGGDVEFDLDWFGYVLQDKEPGEYAVVIGDTADSRLKVTNGYITTCEGILGRNEEIRGGLVVSSGAEWTGRLDDQWYGLTIGQGGRGEVRVEEGGILRHGHGWAGAWWNSEADIVVTGFDSQWYVDGWFGLAQSGKAEVTVTDQGYVRMGKCDMALQDNSRAKVTVEGTDSTWECAAGWETSLVIGGLGRAEVEITNNGLLLNTGYLGMAEGWESFGMLTLEKSRADVWRSMSVGGDMEEPGGIAIVNVGHNSLLSVGDAEGDKLIIWGGGTVILNNSELEMDFGGSVGEVVVNGVLAGGGMIWGNVRNVSGSVRCGTASNNPVLEIGGDYIQSQWSSLDFELVGAQEEVDYGKLEVSNGGQAELDGRLNVALLNGFVPENSDTFRIVDAPGGITGKFANAESSYIFSGGTFDVEYTGTEVWLKNFRTSPACLKAVRGDLNGDCKVNLIDLAIMGGAWLRSGII